MSKNYDASNPKDVSDAEKQQAELDKDLVEVMSTSRGRRWMYDLIYGADGCHMLSNSFTGDGPSTEFNEGSRQVGVKLHQDILSKCGNATYLTMLKENMEDV